VGDDIFLVEDLGNNRIRLTPTPTHVSEAGTPVNKALLQPIVDELGYLSANHVTSVAGRTGAVTLSKSDVGLGNVQNYGIATQAQAQEGTANDVYMTPLRVAEAIEELGRIPTFPVVGGDAHQIRRQSALAGYYYVPSNGTWVKVVEVPIDELIEGTLRFKFTLQTGKGKVGYVEAEIRRNGVSVGVGARLEAKSTDGSYLNTFTEDIPGWSFGDLIQFYVRGTTEEPTIGGISASYSFV
jgi:hypothetical protein